MRDINEQGKTLMRMFVYCVYFLPTINVKDDTNHYD